MKLENEEKMKAVMWRKKELKGRKVRISDDLTWKERKTEDRGEHRRDNRRSD